VLHLEVALVADFDAGVVKPDVLAGRQMGAVCFRLEVVVKQRDVRLRPHILSHKALSSWVMLAMVNKLRIFIIFSLEFHQFDI
jgi:hypothetical protein